MIKKYSDLQKKDFEYLLNKYPSKSNSFKFLEKSLNQINTILNQGHSLSAADFKKIKESVNNWLTATLQQLNEEVYLPQQTRSESDSEAYWIAVQIHTLKSAILKLKKLPASEYVSKKINILQDFYPVVDILEHFKNLVSKKEKPLTKEEKEKQEVAKFVIPEANNTSVEQVRELLKNLLDKEHPALLKENSEGYQKFVDKVLSLQGNQETLLPFLKKDLSKIFFNIKYLGKERGYSISVKENIENIISEEAEKVTKHIEEFFLTRSQKKLIPIISAKGSLKEIKIVYSISKYLTIECRLRVSFTDGSQFDVQHQAVYVLGVGNVFMRFPTTFHNVILPDGSKMPQPSEERMHTVFTTV